MTATDDEAQASTSNTSAAAARTATAVSPTLPVRMRARGRSSHTESSRAWIPARVTELGEVLAGTRPGRRSRAEITVYKSTGHAIEDVATSRLVYDRAVAEGRGSELHI